MKKPPRRNGMAISESLYGSEPDVTTDNKIANPPQNCNLFSRPSLIPGVEYPISEREEQLLDKAWNHACNLKNRGLQ